MESSLYCYPEHSLGWKITHPPDGHGEMAQWVGVCSECPHIWIGLPAGRIERRCTVWFGSSSYYCGDRYSYADENGGRIIALPQEDQDFILAAYRVGGWEAVRDFMEAQRGKHGR